MTPAQVLFGRSASAPRSEAREASLAPRPTRRPAARLSRLVFISLALAGSGLPQVVAQGGPSEVTICHVAPGSALHQTMTVPASAVAAHEEHGDTVGACAEANADDGPPPVPASNGTGPPDDIPAGPSPSVDGPPVLTGSTAADITTVCHVTRDGSRTLRVAGAGVAAHLAHGDALGACAGPDDGHGHGPPIPSPAVSEEKVTLCHVPPGNPANAHEITIGASAVDAHLAHGDAVGACPPPGDDDPPDGTVTICHVPPGNPENARTKEVRASALAAHLLHGDTEGACATGTIVIEKQTIPDGSTTHFVFLGDVHANLQDGENKTSAVSAGNHTVTENDRPGWTLTGLACDDADSVTDLPNATVTVKVSPGETVTCVFTNMQGGATLEDCDNGVDDDADGLVDGADPDCAAGGTGTITVDKVTIPASSATVFTFTPSWGAAFGLAGGSAPAVSAPLAPGTYSIAEGAMAGWTLESATCSDGSPVSAVALGAGEAITCTFTNKKAGGSGGGGGGGGGGQSLASPDGEDAPPDAPPIVPPAFVATPGAGSGDGGRALPAWGLADGLYVNPAYAFLSGILPRVGFGFYWVAKTGEKSEPHTSIAKGLHKHQ